MSDHGTESNGGPSTSSSIGEIQQIQTIEIHPQLGPTSTEFWIEQLRVLFQNDSYVRNVLMALDHRTHLPEDTSNTFAAQVQSRIDQTNARVTVSDNQVLDLRTLINQSKSEMLQKQLNLNEAWVNRQTDLSQQLKGWIDTLLHYQETMDSRPLSKEFAKWKHPLMATWCKV